MPFSRRLPFAHGRRRHTPGSINKDEASYRDYLDLRIRLGEIMWRSEHEGVKIKLTKDLHYTIDFAVLANDGILEFHDVKGSKKNKSKQKDGTIKDLGHKAYIEDDALVKLKIVAETWPVRVMIVYKVQGNWMVKQVGGEDEPEGQS